MDELLSYTKIGNVGMGYQYRRIYSENHHCPYCNSKLNDLGSFHIGRNIAVSKDDDKAMCLNCGFHGDTSLLADLSKPNKRGASYRMFASKKVSPAVSCLPTVRCCDTCGWWFTLEEADVGNDGGLAFYAGILERFDWDAKDVPIEILKAELPSQTEKYHLINPHRMEDLVGDILGNAYNCEVHHLGYSRDGGIDLLLLLADDPIAVQVKRRGQGKTEGVKPIREFIGASMIKGYKDLLYVTTAEKFSKEAINTAQKSVQLNLANSFQLLDLKRFKDLVVENSSPYESWKLAIKNIRDSKKKMNNIPNPYELN